MAHQWRGLIAEYPDRLPFGEGDPVVTLREGGTPLVHAPALDARTGATVYVKVEGANPTGSFKDRGMTTAISRVLQTGVKVVACASTGNTSASAAAYAVAAGLQSAVVLPAGKIAAGKRAQAIVHGATLIAVDGNFDDCLRIVRELTETHPVALVNSVNPYRLQGQKTAAFEIVDQLGDAPDIHVLPVGNAGRPRARDRRGRRPPRSGPRRSPCHWCRPAPPSVGRPAAGRSPGNAPPGRCGAAR